MFKWGNWEEIHPKIQEEIRYIFKDYVEVELSSYEKRKIIFDHLCRTLTYDIEMLNNIKLQKQGAIRLVRDPLQEILSVMNDRKGICNAIAQYYKLLLEEVGVFSMCVICDDTTEVNHQLNLVYDEENDSYSFDDITSVIVKRGTNSQFFDYDLDDAHELMQGTKENQALEMWTIWPTSMVNLYVGKNPNLKSNFSKTEENFDLLVGKIKSRKNIKHI